MESSLLDHELAIRLDFVPGIFALMALWEVLAPSRVLSACKALCAGSTTCRCSARSPAMRSTAASGMSVKSRAL